jgi:hypothetical protein
VKFPTQKNRCESLGNGDEMQISLVNDSVSFYVNGTFQITGQISCPSPRKLALACGGRALIELGNLDQMNIQEEAL